MGLVDVYDNRTMRYICSFEQTEENILNYVASRAPFDHVRLVERVSDDLILTTIGFFLDRVPDQNWLERIIPRLISKQMKGVSPDQVKTFDRLMNR
ncbi:hypothetical protein [Enterococcus sp. AZ196]|uniref:hypothetical protein n=1 Tax=Enterococcus sp. AZ196 TaxID=2774659 RepID=UPI003D2754DB